VGDWLDDYEAAAGIPQKPQAKPAAPASFLDEYDQARPVGLLEGAQQAGSKFGRGLAEVPAGVLQSVGIGLEAIGAKTMSGADMGKGAQAYAAAVRDFAARALPEVERLRDSFLLSSAPEALGSATGFLLPGGWLKAAGVPPWATTMGLGAAVQAASQFEDARMHGASPEQQWQAWLLGGVVGTSEVLPIASILTRADKASGGTLREALVHALIEGGEEWLQESGTTVASNAIASHILEYDKDRKVLEGALASGNAGGVAGLILSALATASAHSLGRKARGTVATDQGDRRAFDPDQVELTGLKREEGTETQPGAAVPAVQGGEEAPPEGALLPTVPGGGGPGAEAGVGPGGPSAAVPPDADQPGGPAPGAEAGAVPPVPGQEGVGVPPEPEGGAGGAGGALVRGEGAAEGGRVPVRAAPPGGAEGAEAPRTYAHTDEPASNSSVQPGDVLSGVELTPIESLREFNPRKKVEEAKVHEIMAEMAKGRPLPPVIADRSGVIGDGSHRIAAAKALGYTHVPVRFVESGPSAGPAATAAAKRAADERAAAKPEGPEGPRLRTADVTAAMRELVQEYEREGSVEEGDITGAIERARRVVDQRQSAGLRTELDQALEDLVAVSRVEPDIDLGSKKAHAQADLTLATIKKAKALLAGLEEVKRAEGERRKAQPGPAPPAAEAITPEEQRTLDALKNVRNKANGAGYVPDTYEGDVSLLVSKGLATRKGPKGSKIVLTPASYGLQQSLQRKENAEGDRIDREQERTARLKEVRAAFERAAPKSQEAEDLLLEEALLLNAASEDEVAGAFGHESIHHFESEAAAIREGRAKGLQSPEAKAKRAARKSPSEPASDRPKIKKPRLRVDQSNASSAEAKRRFRAAVERGGTIYFPPQIQIEWEGGGSTLVNVAELVRRMPDVESPDLNHYRLKLSEPKADAPTAEVETRGAEKSEKPVPAPPAGSVEGKGPATPPAAEAKGAKAQPAPTIAAAKAIKQAATGKAFAARTIRGQGRKGSPYQYASGPVLGPGRYTTSDPEYAKFFGPTITEHDVSLKNPLVIDSDQQWRALTKKAGWAFPDPFGQPRERIAQGVERLRALIERQGHDGVIVRLDPDDPDGVMHKVFGADQVVEFAAKEAARTPREALDRDIAERVSEAVKPPTTTDAQRADLVELDDDIEDEPGEGGVVADPGELPPAMGAGYPTDPVLGGGANLGTPIGGRLLGSLKPAGKPGKGKVSQPDIIDALSKVVAAAGGKTPIRWGRLGMRNARGIFKVQPEVIRVQTANNVSTAAHEVGHALEKHLLGWVKFGPWRKPLVTREQQKELVALGKTLYPNGVPGGGSLKREGFAEFIRLYTMEPPSAASSAPKFHGWFEGEFLKDRPEVRAALLKVRGLAETWRSQGSVARAEASLVEPTSGKEKLKRFRARVNVDAAIEAFVEAGRPLNELARQAEKRLGRLLTPSEDPFFLYQALRSTHSARTKQMIEGGMVDLAGNRVGPALDQIRPLVKGRYGDFLLYLWGKRSLALLQDPRGRREPGLSLQDAEEIVKTHDSPEFQRAAQMVYDWSEGVLNYAAQASPDLANVVDRIRERDPGSYIPLQREFDELDSIWGDAKKARGLGGAGGVAKRLKGSGRRIKNPFPVLLANAERTVLASHRRMVFDAIFRLSRIEGLGHMIEEVPVDQVPHSANLEQLVRKLKKEQGLEVVDPQTGEAMEPEDLAGEVLTFFSPAQFPKGQDPVIPRWVNGAVKWYRVNHKVAAMLAGMDVYRLPKIADVVLGIPARLLRMGTTGISASFGLITNPFKDPQTFNENSRSSAWAPRIFLEYLKQIAVGGLHLASGGKYSSPYLDAFLNLGGEMAQPFGQDMDHTARAARRLFQGRVIRVVDPRNLYDFVRQLLQFPEGAARVAEIKLVAKDIGWEPGQPMTLDQSLQLLLAGRQVTVDFAAAGWLSRVMNQIAPYHNAAIQGPRASIRSGRRNPSRFLFRGLQWTWITLGLWWLNKDKEWYRELSARARMLYWSIPFKWNGREELLVLPRAHEGPMIFGSIPEALADAWYRQDPAGAREFFGALFDSMVPNVWPVLGEELYEQATNEDRFWKTPIVPQGELRRPPEEQAGEYTSEVAKFLGNLFNKSPRRIDHAIRGVFGGVASDVIDVLGLGGTAPKTSGEPSDIPVVGRLFQRGGPLGFRPRSVEELYNQIEKADQHSASIRVEETVAERQRRLMLEDAGQAVSSLSYVRSQTTDADQRRELTRKMVEIARRALQDAQKAGAPRGPMQQERKRAQKLEEALKR